jgi:hypothetical protein
MKRCVSEIIDKILGHIPITEAELRDEILTYQNSLWNKAPELLRTSECWIPLQIILNKNIQEIDADWKNNVLRIYNNDLE